MGRTHDCRSRSARHTGAEGVTQLSVVGRDDCLSLSIPTIVQSEVDEVRCAHLYIVDAVAWR